MNGEWGKGVLKEVLKLIVYEGGCWGGGDGLICLEKKVFFADKGGLSWPLNFGGKSEGARGGFYRLWQN